MHLRKIKFTENMTKHLTELDTLYADVFQKMTVDERIAYCESLINTTQSFIIKNDLFLNKNIKVRSNEIIIAAQAELKELKK